MPQNQVLRKRRIVPDILCPGDKLAVPSTEPRVYQRPTGKTHQLVVKVSKAKICLQLKKQGQPRASLPCALVVDGQRTAVTTDGSGKLELPIAAKAQRAELILEPDSDNPVTYQLMLRGIHPSSETTGWQARLQNLGYPADVDGDANQAINQAALSLFQAHHQLTPNGTADEVTRSKLEQQHGC